MWAGFRQFILEGNVIDPAVAVILGTALTAIVTSLTNDTLPGPSGEVKLLTEISDLLQQR